MLIGCCVAVCLSPGTVQATVYQYKKDGVWHFTDDPAALPADQRPETSAANLPEGSTANDLNARLTAAFSPKNGVEAATLATVWVETAFGHGSGFFVTADGYLITNRHVIRPASSPGNIQDRATAAQAEALKRHAAQIENQAKRLQTARKELDDFRRYLDSQPDSASRQYNEARYAQALQRYQAGRQSLDAARKKLSAQHSAFEAARLQQRVDAGLAALNQNFTIHLADNTPLYAYVVEISETYDIALLKVDGYITPFLSPPRPFAVAQGEPVYAIGNPVQLRNSVTSGVISGFEGPFVKTNAQIYPGNSGGPLVTARGHVVGINTFKRLTHKFEGLGFAVSIQVVLEDLDSI
ncbi:S1C family serine protease [Desulfosarcina ovata]|uniref:DUF4124 domain-containing protein n=1 Tax=Desulfosarcina ovata subsp. ovata TaxID=2752305 RepID=A0A5K8AE44_9BACT|nr:trypsin-like peptidase domain-containing protein [Desulfosarcina ovata]BBO90892.1 hypothetical protein DSCOOX_40720 [Desulfosarcina ovata subsp. ovata]